MALKEISIAEALGKSSGTEFFSTFVQLVSNSEDALLYEGINKDFLPLLKELQNKFNDPIKQNYIEFLTICNGGNIAGIKFYSLEDENYIDSLYYRNFKTDTRKKLKLPDNYLIIGETNNSLVTLKLGDDDTSFTLMDIYNKEKLEFYYIQDLIAFRFYFRLILQAKKKKIEKEKLEKAKKSFKDQLLFQRKIDKKRAKEKSKEIQR